MADLLAVGGLHRIPERARPPCRRCTHQHVQRTTLNHGIRTSRSSQVPSAVDHALDAPAASRAPIDEEGNRAGVELGEDEAAALEQQMPRTFAQRTNFQTRGM